MQKKVLFNHPALYKLKRFVVETVIWKLVLCGVFRLKQRPLTDADELFQGRRVLVSACGPGDVSTGPSVDSAAEVCGFDVSQAFVERCRKNRPTWKVCVADVLSLPFPEGKFDVSVIYSSLRHIPGGAELVFAELARVTQSRVVFLEGVVPERGILRHILLLWYAVVDGGAHYYTKQEILNIAGRLGLKVERVSEHGPIGHMMFCVLSVYRPGLARSLAE